MQRSAKIVLAFLIAFFLACAAATFLVPRAHAGDMTKAAPSPRADAPDAKPADDDRLCGDWKKLKKAMSEKLGQTDELSAGIIDPAHVLVILGEPDHSSWSMFLVDDTNAACLVNAGTFWANGTLPSSGDHGGEQ